MKTLGLFAATFALVGACAHAQPEPPPAPQSVAQPAPAPPPAQPPPVQPVPEPVARPVTPPQPAGPSASIYFAFDKADLAAESRATLSRVFDGLQKNAHIRVEGNCDERGTREYNLALGQRRADAAKRYLVRLGANPAQIETISWGKERPKALGHDEESWRENRRDDVFATSPATVGLR